VESAPFTLNVSSTPTQRDRLEPLSAQRYKIQFTANRELKEKLEQARALLRHALPSGDFGPIISRAPDLLIDDLLRSRFGAAARRKNTRAGHGSSCPSRPKPAAPPPTAKQPMRHSLPRPGLPPRASIVRHAALYSNVTASAAPGWTPTAYAAAAEHGWNSTTSNLRAKAAAPNRITCGCSAELTIASPPSAPRPRAHRAHDETAPEGATPRAWVSDLGAAPEVRDSRGFESVREQVAPVKSQLRVPPPKVDSPCSV
jgi:hypothetical protein